jgi:phthalate 4,5-dioxygenase
MRRFWQPALLSSELSEPDGPPVRVRLLGEDLIAFRDKNQLVGLVDAFCPHRRAPLFFGRNEECGIRCAYHGWKFDAHGNCMDMPSEPPDTPLKAKVTIKAYPTVERGGIVWAYMGPAALRPGPPDYEWLRAPQTHRHVSKTYEHCNYLQALEGGLDTAHSSFVHNNNLSDRDRPRARDPSPRIEVERTSYGYVYTSTRTIDADTSYVRVYHYVMPHQQMRGGITSEQGGRNAVPKLAGHIWAPIDDEHTFVYNWSCGYDPSVPLTPEYIASFESFTGRGADDLIPGTFRLKRNLGNDYLIDRQLQKTSTFTGITGLNTQDFALQEGMGPIVDRSKEFLGSSDRAIVAMRRLLLEAIDDVAEGKTPRGAVPADSRGIRPFDGFVPVGKSWQDTFADELRSKW